MTSVKREAQLYVESSAVLSWLFGEKRGDVVRQILEDASLVATSELTFVECDRAILREVALGKITAAQSRQLQTGLALQLLFELTSESMDYHDSGDHGWQEHRSRRRLSFGHRHCGM